MRKLCEIVSGWAVEIGPIKLGRTELSVGP